ncbi:MAG: NAD(P)-dependent oxidoreductase [Bacteroidales bacterium]
MKKVLVATEKPFAKPAVEGIAGVLKETGYEMVLLENYKESGELLKAVADADALIVRSDLVTKEVIDAAGKLKIVVRAGAGYDNIDLISATEKDIVVMNTPGQNSNAVAELALGMMVYMARNQFNGTSGTELRGKKLGVHAYGNVGRHVARIAMGFGMDIYGFDPFVEKAALEYAGMKCVESAEKLYGTCRYVSVNIPANEQTIKSINYDLLEKMPLNATLVNTARKEVIDEDSLLKMFAERPDFKYVSDIAPDCSGEIAENYPGRFFFTPKKMGAQTSEANINAGIAAAKQIAGFFEKNDRTFQVNG